ncbi:hypothetical protein QOZ91_000952 [Clostridium sardiniense]|nr:hypothetical protein [Clostridium sardiniense]
MKYIIKESENIILRKTKVENLEFVINVERQRANAQYYRLMDKRSTNYN